MGSAINRRHGAGDCDGVTRGRHKSDGGNRQSADRGPITAGDGHRATEGEVIQLSGADTVGGVHAGTAESHGGDGVGGVERPVACAGIASKLNAAERTESTGVDQRVVLLTQREICRGVDGDVGLVNGDHTVGHDGAGGLDGGHRHARCVFEGDEFARYGHHVLVENDFQISHRRDRIAHLRDHGQRGVVEVHEASGAGRVVAQTVGVFGHSLEAEIGFDGADGRGCESPSACNSIDGGHTQAGAADGVVHGNDFACSQRAREGACQCGGGIVAEIRISKGSGDHAKVVSDARERDVRLRHIGHGMQTGQGAERTAVVWRAGQSGDDARQVGSGDAGDTQERELGNDVSSRGGGRDARCDVHHSLHSICQGLHPGHGVHVACGLEVNHIGQQANFCGAVHTGHTNGGVLLGGGCGGVIVAAIGAGEDGVVGVDEGLNFSRCVHRQTGDGGRSQGVVDGVEVAGHKAGDAGIGVIGGCGRCACR